VHGKSAMVSRCVYEAVGYGLNNSEDLSRVLMLIVAIHITMIQCSILNSL